MMQFCHLPLTLLSFGTVGIPTDFASTALRSCTLRSCTCQAPTPLTIPVSPHTVPKCLSRLRYIAQVTCKHRYFSLSCEAQTWLTVSFLPPAAGKSRLQFYHLALCTCESTSFTSVFDGILQRLAQLLWVQSKSLLLFEWFVT